MTPAEGGAPQDQALHAANQWPRGALQRPGQREVLGITISSHRDLETLLKGFNQAYTRRRQRMLKDASPEQVVHSRLAAEPKRASRRYKPPDSDALPPALQVVAAAKEVLHPDS